MLKNVQKLNQDEFNDFRALIYKLKNFEDLELWSLKVVFSNLRTFKDIQILYEFCLLETGKLRKLLKKSLSAFLMAGIDGMHVIPLKCVKGAAP